MASIDWRRLRAIKIERGSEQVKAMDFQTRKSLNCGDPVKSVIIGTIRPLRWHGAEMLPTNLKYPIQWKNFTLWLLWALPSAVATWAKMVFSIGLDNLHRDDD